MSEEILPSNTDAALEEAKKGAQIANTKPKESLMDMTLHGLAFVESLLPTIKNVLNVVGDVASIIQTGKPMSKPIAPVNNSYTAYNRYSVASVPDPSWRRTIPEVRPTGAIDLYTESDANKIVDRMCDVLDVRGKISVADLYAIVDDVTGSDLSRSIDYTYNNWGWRSTNGVRIIPIGGERPWRLVLPNEVSLRR